MAFVGARIFLRFLRSEASGGLALMASAALAIVVANTPLAATYFGAVHAPIGALSVEGWINDALMALFFLLVGLEIKRELVVGHLATWAARALPACAAAGGMVVPALLYAAVNAHTPETLRGWAIPSATDIAFSLAVLTLLGPRIPSALKVFLTALAILDDLGAVVIIALFYAGGVSLAMLALAAVLFALLLAMNRLGVRRLWPYLVVGAVLWVATFLSGIHPTIAGVLLALTIPLDRVEAASPLHRLEHALQQPVAFFVLPLFGFANAGVAFGAAGLAAVAHPIAIGTALGLFVGKQIGVFGGVVLALALGLAARPPGATLGQLYGVAILCGIGFTMSLFIGGLAFTSDAFHDEMRIGVLGGSLVSAIVGAGVLRALTRRGA